MNPPILKERTPHETRYSAPERQNETSLERPGCRPILSCWLVAPAAADPIAAGTGQQTADANGTRITVFTYRPSGCSDPSLLMVFHGLARNPRSYRDDTRALADRHCMLLVAPLFAKQAFPVWRYQQGGIVKDGVIQNPRDWTGRLVLDLVDWARKQERRPLSYSLLGHSAGAQFLDRLAAFVPTEARRIVVANAGRYVLPSLEIRALWTRQGLCRRRGRGTAASLSGATPDDLSRRRRHQGS